MLAYCFTLKNQLPFKSYLDIARVIKPGLKQVGVLMLNARWLLADIELPIDYYSDNHIANYPAILSGEADSLIIQPLHVDFRTKVCMQPVT